MKKEDSKVKKIEKLKLKAQEHLDDDEEVIATVMGVYESTTLGEKAIRNGIFLATNKRIVFYAKRTFGYDLETFPYSNISSIEVSKKFLGHTITFYASGNKVSMKWIQQGDIDTFLKYTRNAIQKVV
jgi:Bacterial PH domain